MNSEICLDWKAALVNLTLLAKIALRVFCKLKINFEHQEWPYDEDTIKLVRFSP